MIRKFVIVEVMLPGVSGEVHGAASVDEWTGAVEQVDCQQFDFWCDQRDVPIVLDARQRQLASDVVQRALEGDIELTNSSEPYHASAASFPAAVATTISEGQRVLAAYLENIGEPERAAQGDNDSRVRRSG